ncbi:RNA-directed DNA polymerase, eukaryota, reverse transcriptase zinc-binding domain protein [Tanacetum coccineum]
MDIVIATMHHNGMGRLDYARVLVEMDVDKEFKKIIKVQYTDSENKVKGTKRVNVTYDWKPTACTHCKVFDHDFKGCKKRPRTLEEEEVTIRKEKEHKNRKRDVANDYGVHSRWRNTSNVHNNNNDKGKQNEMRSEQSNEGLFRN